MPYEYHRDLTTPSNKTVLWRYMDFARFIEMIESQSLWFSRVDQLEDPLEGTHTDAERKHIRKHIGRKRADQLIRVFRVARKEVYVNCWRSGSNESLAMWDLYGKGSGIVAVKCTVGRLKEAFARSSQPVFIAKSKYYNWNDAPGIDNVLVACSRKDVGYQHESEVRAMIIEPSAGSSKGWPPGCRLPIDLNGLITEVFVGPREPKWVFELVKQVMKSHRLSARVLASDRLTARR